MEYYTPPQVAKMLQVSRDKVHNWIRRGRLKAMNVSAAFRPSYRISQADLDEFARQNQPMTSRRPTARKTPSRLLPKVKHFIRP